MTVADIATLVLAVVGVLTLLGGVVAYFYGRGDKEGRFEAAMDRNTKATDRLTEKLEVVTDTLHEHDIRLTKLEANKNGSAPANRDAGTKG